MRWLASIGIVASCGRHPSHDDAAVADPRATCLAKLAADRAKLAPVLTKLGLVPLAAQGRCAQPPEMSAWFGDTLARDRLLGWPVVGDLAPLVGHWTHAGSGLDDDVDWTLAPDGVLAVVRTVKTGKREVTREPPHTVAIGRARELVVSTGDAKQFVPFFVADHELDASWTTGALAVPDATGDVALPDTDGAWVIRHGTTCELLDPMAGLSPLDCTFANGELHYLRASTPRVWRLVGTTLVDTRMERFTR